MKKRRARVPIVIIVLIILLAGYVFRVTTAPLPTLAATTSDLAPKPSSVPSIVWPHDKEAALGAVGYGVIATNGEQARTPIASIAKTILALSVLDRKPLAAGEAGPTITITQQDLNIYDSYFVQGGSIVPVHLGEQLTERQALEALLVPSGDNIADTLANWAFGSVQNYLDYANQKLAKLGLSATHVADASGVSPQSVSSAHDLIVIGEQILAQPTLAAIVGESQVTLPVMGVAGNYNSLLGQNGVVGIKTGNTDEAGGCLLFAVKTTVSGQPITIIGAVLGAANLQSVLSDSRSFIQANASVWHLATVVKAGQAVGTFTTPWGTKVDAIAKQDVSVLTAGDQSITAKVKLDTASPPLAARATVGELTATAGGQTLTTPVILKSAITKPPLSWRLVHIF